MENFVKKVVLVCLMVTVLAPAQLANAASFSDVPADHVNYDAIEFLRSKNIVAGYEDGTFGSDRAITRAEASKIIDNAFNIDTTIKFTPVFSDVKEGKWYFPFVMAGKEAGFIKGYDNGTFLPDKQVKLSETLKMALSAGKATIPNAPSKNVFADVSEDNWVSPYALYAKTYNIILPDKLGNISPDKLMTRSAFAEIIYRTMTVLESGEKEFPLDGHWALYDSPDLPFTMKYNAENWKIINGKHDVVFYNPDEDRYQFSPTKIYPNTGRIEVTLDRNDTNLTESKYFDNIKESFTDAKYQEFEWNGFRALEGSITSRRIVDWYIYLDNGYVLTVYTEYGNGTEIYRFPQIMKAMLGTLEFKDMEISFAEDNKDLLNTIFKNILVEKKGMDTLNLLPDKTIIETDAIGVGTGPVDYYYSEGVNYTFKYERKADVILDKKVGKTSAF